MSLATTGRVLIAAVFLGLPLVSVQTATAAPETQNTQREAYAATQRAYLASLERAAAGRSALAGQQQAYVESLERAAEKAADTAPAARAAFAARQRSYIEHLALAARAADTDASGGEPAFAVAPRDTGDGVPVSVAALLAIGGIALGTGGTVASRRLPFAQRQRVAA